MDVIVMQVFVSLLLVAGGVLLFVFSVRKRTFEHADRLALLPLEEDKKDE
jgi:cbb3-type cytochrome oxidase maturation FixS-like protein